MTRKFTPRPYQSAITKYILENPRCAVYADMGLGKTCATLNAIDGLMILGEVDASRPVLVIAPKRVAVSTWPDEVRKWQHLSHIRVEPITGTAPQREAALRQPAEVYTINYEQLAWLVAHYGDGWPFRVVIADESTKLKGFRLRQGGQRAGALGKVAHSRVDRLVELTGTPSPNGLQDLWGQLWFIDRGHRLGRSYQAYIDRWFKQGFDGYSVVALPHAQAEIQALIGDVCIRIDAHDHFNLAEPIRNVIEVDLPGEARRIYDNMEKQMYMELAGAEVEAFSAAARTMKCLQIANGAAYTDDAGTWAEIHDQKIQALAEVIDGAGAPVLVAYHFKSDLVRLQAAFPKGRALDADPKTIRDWNAGKIPILFAHPASAGHGLNLQDGGNVLVFFSLNWNLEEHQQIIERIGPTRQMQAGHDRPVFIHYILARRTVDQLVLARLETKRDVQDLLLEAMKERQSNVEMAY